MPEQLPFEYEMIDQMIETYDDPYSRFVIHPFYDGTADQAGIIDGDIIIQTDNWQVPPFSDLNTVIAAIR